MVAAVRVKFTHRIGWLLPAGQDVRGDAHLLVGEFLPASASTGDHVCFWAVRKLLLRGQQNGLSSTI